MIGGEHSNHRLGILGGKRGGAQTHGIECVAADGFAQKLARKQTVYRRENRFAML